MRVEAAAKVRLPIVVGNQQQDYDVFLRLMETFEQIEEALGQRGNIQGRLPTTVPHNEKLLVLRVVRVRSDHAVGLNFYLPALGNEMGKKGQGRTSCILGTAIPIDEQCPCRFGVRME